MVLLRKKRILDRIIIGLSLFAFLSVLLVSEYHLVSYPTVKYWSEEQLVSAFYDEIENVNKCLEPYGLRFVEYTREDAEGHFVEMVTSMSISESTELILQLKCKDNGSVFSSPKYSLRLCNKTEIFSEDVVFFEENPYFFEVADYLSGARFEASFFRSCSKKIYEKHMRKIEKTGESKYDVFGEAQKSLSSILNHFGSVQVETRRGTKDSELTYDEFIGDYVVYQIDDDCYEQEIIISDYWRSSGL